MQPKQVTTKSWLLLLQAHVLSTHQNSVTTLRINKHRTTDAACAGCQVMPTSFHYLVSQLCSWCYCQFRMPQVSKVSCRVCEVKHLAEDWGLTRQKDGAMVTDSSAIFGPSGNLQQ